MTMATILSKAGLKMCILLSMAFFRGKVVKFQAIYNLATREMSNNLRKKGTEKTAADVAEKVCKRLAEAEEIVKEIPSPGVNIENPVQAMRMFSVTLDTGLDRKMPLPARTLLKLDSLLRDEELTDSQKEKILCLVSSAYVTGTLTPLIHLDLFSNKLDQLLLKTRCKTREEMMLMIGDLEEKIKNKNELLEQIRELQQADIRNSKSKPPLTLAEKTTIINGAFSRLRDLDAKHSFTPRTIQNWDNGKCPYDGYSSRFNEIELLSWANKIVGEIRSKTALKNMVHGMTEEEISRKARRY